MSLMSPVAFGKGLNTSFHLINADNIVSKKRPRTFVTQMGRYFQSHPAVHDVLKSGATVETSAHHNVLAGDSLVVRVHGQGTTRVFSVDMPETVTPKQVIRQLGRQLRQLIQA